LSTARGAASLYSDALSPHLRTDIAILTHDCITSCASKPLQIKKMKRHGVSLIELLHTEIAGRAPLSAEIDLVIEARSQKDFYG
jgi:hypothetical protein